MKDRRHLFIMIVAAIFAVQGCTRGETGTGTETAATEAAGEGHDAEAVGEHDEHGEDHDDGQGPGEIARAETPISEPVTMGAETPDDVEDVDPAAVLADPEAYRGKAVRFTGRVNGHCVHSRNWYSIEVPGASPPYLRILSQPTFRVPEGVIGATVVTHGTVDSQDLPRARVQHMEVEHGLGTTEREETGDTITLTVIRAAGAVFSPIEAE